MDRLECVAMVGDGSHVAQAGLELGCVTDDDLELLILLGAGMMGADHCIQFTLNWERNTRSCKERVSKHSTTSSSPPTQGRLFRGASLTNLWSFLMGFASVFHLANPVGTYEPGTPGHSLCDPTHTSSGVSARGEFSRNLHERMGAIHCSLQPALALRCYLRRSGCRGWAACPEAALWARNLPASQGLFRAWVSS